MVPFAYQDFYGKEITIGNSKLKTSKINNLDLRFEWYPSPTELISVGLFNKQFTDPIDVAIFLAGGADRINKVYTNVLMADTNGIEFELRYKLRFIPINVGYGNFSLNATISKSDVINKDSVQFFTGYYFYPISEKNRTLQGQSNNIVNGNINLSLLSGYNFNLAFNWYSERLHSAQILGNEYEFSYTSLNFTTSKKFDNFKISLILKNLLNSDITHGLYDSNDNKLITRRYSPGLSGSIGITYNL